MTSQLIPISLWVLVAVAAAAPSAYAQGFDDIPAVESAPRGSRPFSEIDVGLWAGGDPRLHVRTPTVLANPGMQSSTPSYVVGAGLRYSALPGEPTDYAFRFGVLGEIYFLQGTARHISRRRSREYRLRSDQLWLLAGGLVRFEPARTRISLQADLGLGAMTMWNRSQLSAGGRAGSSRDTIAAARIGAQFGIRMVRRDNTANWREPHAMLRFRVDYLAAARRTTLHLTGDSGSSATWSPRFLTFSIGLSFPF